MAEKQLFFLDPLVLDPDQQIFSLRVQQNWNLADLRKALKAEHFPFNDRSPDEIKVLVLSQYLNYPHTPDPLKLVINSAKPTYNDISLAMFNPFENIVDRFPTVEQGDQQIHMIVYVVHIIVKPEALPERPLKRRRLHKDTAVAILRRLQAPHNGPLPTLEGLAGVVKNPLPDDMKIPINIEYMDVILSSSDMATQDLECLFRVTPDDEYNLEIYTIFKIFTEAVESVPPTGGTESAFIWFWDTCVRNVILKLVDGSMAIRNSNRHTETGKFRPDYACLLEKHCVFRGEEKGPDDMKDPRMELVDKLSEWRYGSVPYIFGYHATGVQVTLVAIAPPTGNSSNASRVHDLATFNLGLKTERIANVCCLIRLASLFRGICTLMGSSIPEFAVMKRENSIVEFAGNCIIKEYISEDRVSRSLRLEMVYNLLRTKQVPHTDHQVHHFDTKFVLTPRGLTKKPDDARSLLEAVKCVLEMLHVLHEQPNPLFHRDIRWPNVMQSLDDPHSWFVIDWEDASTPPTPARPYFNTETHSPHIFHDGHGAEVDLWGVGHLISDVSILDVPSELRTLGQWMQHDENASVDEALAQVNRLLQSPPYN